MHPVLKLAIGRWRELTILVLLAALAWCIQDNRRLEAVASAQPEVKTIYVERDTKAERSRKKEHRGRVTVVAKYVPGQDGKPVLAEKTTTQDPVDVALNKISRSTRRFASVVHQTPACPSSPKRFVGLWLSPRHGKNVEGAYVGYGFGPFDLALGWAWEGLRGPKAQVSIRF